MTQKSSDIGPKRRSKQPFLRHRRASRKQSTAADRTLPRPDSDLDEIYSELQVGQEFIENSLGQVASAKRLIAILIEIDMPSDPAKLDEGLAAAMAAVRKDLAAVIQIICQNEGGCWGVLDYPIFACLIADQAWPYGIQVAQRIKEQLAALRSDTLTIGMAEHPCLDYNRSQLFENAHKALQHARFFGPDSMVGLDAVSLNISGDQQYDNANYQDAIDEFERGLQLDPINANLHNSLGVCYGVLERYGKARRAFERALEINPEDAMVLYNLGLVHLYTDDRRSAADFFLTAWRIDSSIYEVAYQLGRLHLEWGQLKRARGYFEAATQMESTTSAAFASLGECYLALHNKQKAVLAFKKAIQLNGNEAGALSELGWLYYEMEKNLEIAEVFCRQSVIIAPHSGMYHFRLGRLLESRGKLDEARRELDRAAELGFDTEQADAKAAVKVEESHTGHCGAFLKGSAA